MDKIVKLAHSWANVYLTASVIANVQYFTSRNFVNNRNLEI